MDAKDDTHLLDPTSPTSDHLSQPGTAAHPEAPPDGLPEHECWDLLRREVVGRLAVTHGGVPDIFPVNHLVDHGSIVIRTAAGTKLATAAGRPVAYEVDGYDRTTGTAWSVVVRGQARKILEREENLAALRLPLVPWHEGRKAWFIRIDPTEVSGRRIVLSPGAREAVGRGR